MSALDRKCWYIGVAILLLLLMPALSVAQTPTPTPLWEIEGTENKPTELSFQIQPNLAQNKPVSSSGHLQGNPPDMAVDGKMGYEQTWVSPGGEVQWIEIDFEVPVTIERIEFLVSQPRTAETLHQVWGRGPNGEEHLLVEFSQVTSNNQFLQYSPPEPWSGIQFLRIETHETPSLAAWQEIQVFGREVAQPVSPSDQSTIIFHNGQIITMEEDSPLAEAIAVRGDKILSVGTSENILAHIGSDTTVVDLQGLTLMPGFVDAHTHVFSTPESVGEDLHGVQELALSKGVTTLGDMGGTSDLIAQLQEMDRDGELRLRVSLYMPYNDNCGNRLPENWYLQYPQSIEPGALLHIPGIKVFSDGGSCNAPAVSFEYPSGVGNGDLYYSQGEMNEIVAAVQNEGYQVAIHALGDRAITQVLNAIENALRGQPNSYRHRIEHNAVVRPDMYHRYSEVRPVPLLFGAFPTCFLLGETSQFKYAIPEEYQTWEWPWLEMLEANPDVIFAWHGDTPVFEFDPIRHLYGFVTRIDFAPDGSLCEPPDWLARNTIPVDVALRLMTINSAYALHRDNDIGSLREGKYADLIVLSGDPLSIEPGATTDLEVWLTMVNGRVEYCADGHEDLCP